MPNCCQKCAKSASAGTGKISNSSDMYISTRLLPKVCQVCQCWHWQKLKQQLHSHQHQIATKSVPSLPVLALAKPQTATTCTSVPNCCRKCAKSASAGTAKFLGNGMAVSVGTDLVLPSPMGNYVEDCLTKMIKDHRRFIFVDREES